MNKHINLCFIISLFWTSLCCAGGLSYNHYSGQHEFTHSGDSLQYNYFQGRWEFASPSSSYGSDHVDDPIQGGLDRAQKIWDYDPALDETRVFYQSQDKDGHLILIHRGNPIDGGKGEKNDR